MVRGGSFFSSFGHMRSTERNNGPKIGDGETTGLDFLVWQLETTGGLTSMFSDFDDDGDVDADDLVIWHTSYGVDDGGDADIGGHTHNFTQRANGFRVAAPALPILTVPEPTSAVLVLAAAMGLALRRRPRRV